MQKNDMIHTWDVPAMDSIWTWNQYLRLKNGKTNERKER